MGDAFAERGSGSGSEPGLPDPACPPPAPLLRAGLRGPFHTWLPAGCRGRLLLWLSNVSITSELSLPRTAYLEAPCTGLARGSLSLGPLRPLLTWPLLTCPDSTIQSPPSPPRPVFLRLTLFTPFLGLRLSPSLPQGLCLVLRGWEGSEFPALICWVPWPWVSYAPLWLQLSHL